VTSASRQLSDGYVWIYSEGTRFFSPSDVATHTQASRGILRLATRDRLKDKDSTTHEVKNKTIVVDLNHPLAGNTLNFDVKVTDSQVRRDKITSA
jgi:FKBP-type peptidyl-prolyl cis-trans isomerase 2